MNLIYETAFDMASRDLADHIGASALLYAALAYFVFDEDYFLEDLSTNYPELNNELMCWLEAFVTDQSTMIEHLRKFYETSIGHGRWPKPIEQHAFRLLIVTYYREDGCIFIGASRNESDSKYGSEWHVPIERRNRPSRYRDELRRTLCLPCRSGNVAVP